MDITWRADFDLCTILLLVMFAAIYFKKNRFKILAGRLYEMMLVDLFLATIVEYTEVYFSHINPIATPVVKCILLCVYEMLISSLAFMFSMYVFIVARKGVYTKKRWVWNIIYSPAALTLILIATTQATHLVFYFKDGHFNMGPLYYGVYVVIAMYVVFAAVVTIASRNNMLRRDRISFMIFLLCTSFGMLYQAVTTGGLVANFLSSLGMILIYFTQQSSYDTLDENSSLYNSRALWVHITELINAGQSFRIVALTPDQLIDLMHVKGSFYTDSLIRQVGDCLKELYGATGTYTLGSGRFAIITFDEWKEDIRRNINKGLSREFEIGEEKINITTSGCYLQYPGDFDTADAAVNLISRGIDIAVKTGSTTLITIDNYDSMRDTLVTRLKKEQLTLEREKQEAEIAKANAETSDKAKTTFLAHMSHEIRTPLTTIMGMTEIMLRGSLSDYARKNTERIYSASKSLLQIINDILDFSKIESGKMEIIEEPFDVVQVIESAMNVLEVRCNGKPIETVMDIDPNLPSSLVGDETRIKQILYNLLSNAAKYTDQGTITFTVSWQPDESSVIASVKDTGRGIKESDMALLFESFSRFDGHANKAIEGTGLGLAITKRMTELMGGILEVESEYGKGSCFSFRLKHKVADASPIGSVTSANSGKSEFKGSEMKHFIAPTARILVVDDNSFNRNIADELIAPHMLRVDQAASGRECIEKVKSASYDIVFLDHMMPGMDGFETLEHLKQMPEFIREKTPVIAFSANAVSGMREKFGQAGFANLLTKPIEVDALEDMLMRYLPPKKIQMMNEEEFGIYMEQYNGSDNDSQYDVSRIGAEHIDVTEGLAHVGGDIAKYFKVNRVILSEYGAVVQRLTDEFENKDFAGYTIDVHALKSNMASIGASEAAKLAKTLEDAGRNGDYDVISQKHEQLISLFTLVCDELKTATEDYDAFCNDGNKESKLLARLGEMMPEYGDCLTCIKLLIDDFEYDAAIRLAELFAGLLSDSDERQSFEKVASKLKVFDYDGTLELIRNAVPGQESE